MARTEVTWTTHSEHCKTFVVLTTADGYVNVMGQGYTHQLPEGGWTFAVTIYKPDGFARHDMGFAETWEQVEEETFGAVLAAYR